MQGYVPSAVTVEQMADILEVCPESSTEKKEVGEFTVTKVVHPLDGDIYFVDAALSNIVMFTPEKLFRLRNQNLGLLSWSYSNSKIIAS